MPAIRALDGRFKMHITRFEEWERLRELVTRAHDSESGLQMSPSRVRYDLSGIDCGDLKVYSIYFREKNGKAHQICSDSQAATRTKLRSSLRN